MLKVLKYSVTPHLYTILKVHRFFIGFSQRLTLQQRNSSSKGVRRDVMGFQSVFLVKRLFAVLALKWFVRRMRSLVCVQRGSQCKSFPADVTLERSLAGVTVHVRLEVSLLVEALATELTLVHAYVGMRSHVVGQVRQLLESPPTFLAFMWLLSCVRVSVNLHINFLVKPLAAKIAAEWLVIRVGAHVRV